MLPPSRSGALISSLLLILALGGCEFFGISPAGYFLDHSEIVTAVGWETRSLTAEGSGEVILIPPHDESGEAVIAVRLDNPRNFNNLRISLINELPEPEEDPGSEGEKRSRRVEQTASAEVLIHIAGSRENDEYALKLVMESADGLREFKTYTLPLIRCASFQTGLKSLTITDKSGERDIGWDALRKAYMVLVAHDVSAPVIKAAAVHGEARIFIDDVAGGTKTVGPLQRGENQFTLRVVARSGTEGSFTIIIHQVDNNAKSLLSFSFANPAAAGEIDEAAGMVVLFVPEGTNVSGIIPRVQHTGVRYSPGGAQNFADPVTYTIYAEDGSSRDYTVRVIRGTITEVEIVTPPAKTSYRIGEELDTAGLVLRGIDSTGGTISPLPGLKFTGFDSGSRGEKTVTVTHVSSNRSTSFTVTVKNNAAALQQFEVKNGALVYTLDPPFGPDILSYTLTVPHDVDSVTLTAAPAADSYARITGGGEVQTIGLSGGTGSASVTVTAEDDVVTRTYTLAVTRGAPGSPSAGITVDFSEPGDENWVLSPVSGLSWLSNTSLSLTVSETYDTYEWYLDGELLSGANTGVLNKRARDFTSGYHTISVRVTRGGIIYSKELSFEVVADL